MPRKGFRKYGNKKTAGYDSRHEKRRADVLKFLERSGEISDLKEQVKFELIPSQRGEDGKVVERPCSYYADFVYRGSDGFQVVEDAKGNQTKEYIIKRKLMLKVHGIRIKEV